jgi:hypothetical protein
MSCDLIGGGTTQHQLQEVNTHFYEVTVTRSGSYVLSLSFISFDYFIIIMLFLV